MCQKLLLLHLCLTLCSCVQDSGVTVQPDKTGKDMSCPARLCLEERLRARAGGRSLLSTSEQPPCVSSSAALLPVTLRFNSPTRHRDCSVIARDRNRAQEMPALGHPTRISLFSLAGQACWGCTSTGCDLNFRLKFNLSPCFTALVNPRLLRLGLTLCWLHHTLSTLCYFEAVIICIALTISRRRSQHSRTEKSGLQATT